jgi:hypothetical protein
MLRLRNRTHIIACRTQWNGHDRLYIVFVDFTGFINRNEGTNLVDGITKYIHRIGPSQLRHDRVL